MRPAAPLVALVALAAACSDGNITTGNSRPSATILAPLDGATLSGSEPIELRGVVGDSGTAARDLRVTWASSQEGVLYDGPPDDAEGTATFLWADPALGAQDITLTVLDPGGASASRTVRVTVAANAAPTCAIEAPEDGAVVSGALDVALAGRVDDAETAAQDLVVVWTSDLDGALGGGPPGPGGLTTVAAMLSPGTHAITLSAEDADGDVCLAGIALRVNGPPSAPGVAVAPAAPTQADDLLCAVTGPSSDPEGDVVAYGYAWLLDGAPSPFTDALLPWEATAVGDLWTCVVTPDDGLDAGPVGTATVSVAAGCGALEVDPAAPGEVVVPASAGLDLFGGDFTIEAWVWLDAVPAGAGATIARKEAPGAGWSFVVGGASSGAAGRLRFLRPGGGVTGSLAVPTGAWAHVAASWDAGSGLLGLFVDGEAAGSGTVAAPPAAGGADLALGGGPAGPWDGLLDDVRLSASRRYATAFVPQSLLPIDAATTAFWGFEEAGGAAAKDLSANGYDGALAGGVAITTAASTCALDQAPTAPAVAVSPAFPLDDDDLVCAIVTPGVDAEGAAVTHTGVWLQDGVPVGVPFSAFPATLPAADTGEREEWTCSVTASDGGQSGAAGTDAVWVGAMPLGALAVPNPLGSASTSIAFAPPLPGLVQAELSNPDASRDGVFTVQVLGYTTFWLFTGRRDWSYGGVVVTGRATDDLEFNLDPTFGTATLQLAYAPAGALDGTGPDTLELWFAYGRQLGTSTAAYLLGSETAPLATTPTTLATTLLPGERLLVEAALCGAGGGGHGLYDDTDGATGNDGVARVDSGQASGCAIPLHSRPITAGPHTLTLVNEDDYFPDNTNTRRVNVYRYTP